MRGPEPSDAAMLAPAAGPRYPARASRARSRVTAEDASPGTDRPQDRPEPLSRRLLRAGGRRGESGTQTLGEVIEGLGDRSFGWLILIFATINLLPTPPGSTVVLAMPLLIVTAQMALGLGRIRLPGVIARRRVDRRAFQRMVLWLRPLIRPVERLVRPRLPRLFTPGSERTIGGFLFCVSAALSLPIPISVYLPAIALFVTAIGLVERDGAVTLAGLAIGLVAIAVTATLAMMIVTGAIAAAT